eukprot:3638892-Lingulodinium_polyedra.AAC.1
MTELLGSGFMPMIKVIPRQIDRNYVGWNQNDRNVLHMLGQPNQVMLASPKEIKVIPRQNVRKSR